MSRRHQTSGSRPRADPLHDMLDDHDRVRGSRSQRNPSRSRLSGSQHYAQHDQEIHALVDARAQSNPRTREMRDRVGYPDGCPPPNYGRGELCLYGASRGDFHEWVPGPPPVNGRLIAGVDYPAEDDEASFDDYHGFLPHALEEIQAERTRLAMVPGPVSLGHHGMDHQGMDGHHGMGYGDMGHHDMDDHHGTGYGGMGHHDMDPLDMDGYRSLRSHEMGPQGMDRNSQSSRGRRSGRGRGPSRRSRRDPNDTLLDRIDELP